MRYPRKYSNLQRNTAMKVSTFSGFLQEKIEFNFKEQLSKTALELAEIFDMLELYRFLPHPASTGRPPISRLSLLKAFFVKSALNYTENKKLRKMLHGNDELRKLCGWTESHDVPSESTFSRSFAEFAQLHIGEHIHEHIVSTAFSDRLILHVSRDASALPAREKAVKKDKKPKVRGKRGRPKKGTPPKKKKLRRLEKQLTQDVFEMMSELPTECNWGSKKNSKGNLEHWRGYKVHADFTEEGVPVSFCVTSASVHDSQVAIPLIHMSSDRVTYLYELMDAGYDMKEIKTVAGNHNHAPIIRPNNRRSKNKRTLDPASARRYRIRATAERGFSELKDNYGISASRLRGHEKICTHVSFAMIILTVRKLRAYGLLSCSEKQKTA